MFVLGVEVAGSVCQQADRRHHQHALQPSHRDEEHRGVDRCKFNILLTTVVCFLLALKNVGESCFRFPWTSQI
jgi:hypothetical protein